MKEQLSSTEAKESFSSVEECGIKSELPYTIEEDNEFKNEQNVDVKEEYRDIEVFEHKIKEEYCKLEGEVDVREEGTYDVLKKPEEEHLNIEKNCEDVYPSCSTTYKSPIIIFNPPCPIKVQGDKEFYVHNCIFYPGAKNEQNVNIKEAYSETNMDEHDIKVENCKFEEVDIKTYNDVMEENFEESCEKDDPCSTGHNNSKMSTKKEYKYCVVPMCKNTTYTAPNKYFFAMPRGEAVRKSLWKAMKRDEKKNLSSTSTVYCCQDHFNFKEDLDNYLEFKLMPNIRPRLRRGVLPHLFECQKVYVANIVNVEREDAIKRIRLQDKN